MRWGSKRARSGGLLFAIATVVMLACGTDGDATPPSPNEFTLRPRVFVVSRAQADAVTVAPDRLVFPKAASAGLLERTAGDVLVGDRNATASSANPDGFARKVAAVEDAGDTVIVRTAGHAALTEIFERAKFAYKWKLSEYPALPEATAGTGTRTVKPQFFGQLSDTFGGDYAPVEFLKAKVTKKFQLASNKEVELGVEANGKLSEAKFLFTPTIEFAADIDAFGLQHFHTSVEGAVDVGIVAEMEFALMLADETLTKKDQEGLATRIAQELANVTEMNPKFSTPELVHLRSPGPPLGGVPTTIELGIKASCTVTVKGGLAAQAGIRASSSLKAGIAYDSAIGWYGISDARFDLTPVGPELTKVYGGMELKCGLQPKVTWKLAGAVGPFLQFEGGDKLTFDYAETCPTPPLASEKPVGEATLKNALYLEGAAGVTIEALGLEAEIARPLFNELTLPLSEGTFDFSDTHVWGSCPPAGDGGVPGTACTLANGCTMIGGKRIHKVSGNTNGFKVCEAVGLECAGVPVFSPPSAACSAFHPSAPVTSTVDGWQQGIYCDGQAVGPACNEEIHCHDCPLCSSDNLHCSTYPSPQLSELYVECRQPE